MDSTTGQWRDGLAAMMQSFTTDPNAEFHPAHIDAAQWGWLAERLEYVRADFTDVDAIRALGKSCLAMPFSTLPFPRASSPPWWRRWAARAWWRRRMARSAAW
ncbi:hypothetical protein RAA17_03840 [Komagataeibacter rhaeticus]|nr:hypothetical protein [Komagataeibacter rhaeticus]